MWCCYKRVQSFRVHCLFTAQYYTEDYITFTDVIKAIGGSISCKMFTKHYKNMSTFWLQFQAEFLSKIPKWGTCHGGY